MSFFVGQLVLSNVNYLAMWIFLEQAEPFLPKTLPPNHAPIKMKLKGVEGSKKWSITDLKWRQKNRTNSTSSRNSPLGNKWLDLLIIQVSKFLWTPNENLVQKVERLVYCKKKCKFWRKKNFSLLYEMFTFGFFRKKKRFDVAGRKWEFHSLKKLSVYLALFISKMSEISTFHLFFYIKGGASTPGRKKVSLYLLGWNLFSTKRKSVILFCQKLLKCKDFEHFLIKTP